MSIFETSVTGSSSITHIEWDEGTLAVTMRDGSRLVYSDVPLGEYWDFAGASSKGAYFNKNIRDEYSFSYG
jgi:hypothetical protein